MKRSHPATVDFPNRLKKINRACGREAVIFFFVIGYVVGKENAKG